MLSLYVMPVYLVQAEPSTVRAVTGVVLLHQGRPARRTVPCCHQRQDATRFQGNNTAR